MIARAAVPALLALAAPAPLAAAAMAVQEARASAALNERAAELPALFAGRIAYADWFADAFKAEVPEAELARIVAALTGANGAATAVESLVAINPHEATLRLAFANGVASVWLAVDPRAPHRVTGFRITAGQVRDDSASRITADLAALPGRHALLVRELTGSGPPLLAVAANRPGAIASGFKLFVLAAAVRAVRERRLVWDRVLPLAPDILSSATMARWPAGMPVTLQVAATAMIATSDNRATDTVIAALDWRRLESDAVALGLDPSSLPLLTTRQFIALKTDGFAGLAGRWRTLDPAARRRLLSDQAARIAGTPTPAAAFRSGPRAIDGVEWFASADALARVLDRLRRDADPAAMGALAVNRGADAVLARRFAWLGYKGGSEAGVLSMSYLVETRSGRWFAVTGWWNDPGLPVDDAAFAVLMSRALALIPAE